MNAGRRANPIASEVLESAETPTVVDVLIPVAIDTAYSYRVAPAMVLAPGDVVTVPLGTRTTMGVVWSGRRAAGDNLKPVLAKLDLPPMRAPLREFVDWLARWTLSPRGMVLRMALRWPFELGPEPVRVGVRRLGPPPARMTPARLRVIEALPSGEVWPKRRLAETARCSVAVIDGLIDEATLETVALAPGALVAAVPDPEFPGMRLEPSQAAAAKTLADLVRAGTFSVALLEGVTGSGKTEVYFAAIAEALRASRQALILLPEIALTAQFLDRFAARFGVRPAEWHSGVPSRRRARTWAGVACGEIPVVVGARSSLFLPFPDLAVVIVDEEHEGAYKQDDGVTYHARDMAVVRGRLERAAVILASATPSLETRVNAQTGRYGYVRLPARVGGRAMPAITAIDLRKEGPPRGRWIAPRLVDEVRSAVARGEQALLFLNRRGYAPLTLCRTCGHRFMCPQCSAWLVEHRFRGALMCHHCGHVERRPTACPACGTLDSLTACGPGVERIAEEASHLFPEARLLVLSSDFFGGGERLKQELAKVADGSVDVVVGTQLVAKGHHFPNLTVAGVLDADVGLANADLRAAERTFQLLQQVAGRTGRGDQPGRTFLQTWQPEHPVIRALLTGDAERFYATEIESRRRAAMPPFARLAALIVSAPDRTAAETHGRALARAAHDVGSVPHPDRQADGAVDVFGPSEAPVAMIRGRHRFRLLVRAPRAVDLQGFLLDMFSAAPKPRGGVRVDVDIDPQTFS